VPSLRDSKIDGSGFWGKHIPKHSQGETWVKDVFSFRTEKLQEDWPQKKPADSSSQF
jgi:hypothetical protein